MYAPFIIATNGQLQSGYQDGWTRHLFTHGLGITLPGLEQVATPLFRAQTRVAEVAAKKRTDTDTTVPTVWKYPQDVYPVAVNWSGRYPSGATSLGVVLVTVTDALEADVTSTRLLKSQVDGDRSLAYIQGGAAGDRYTVSVAQTFNTGAVLYEYVEVEVRNLADLRIWKVAGSQLVLSDPDGTQIATLYSSGNERFDGQTSTGTRISLSR